MQEESSFVLGYNSHNGHVEFDVAQFEDDIVLIFSKPSYSRNFLNDLARRTGNNDLKNFGEVFITKIFLKNKSISILGTIAKNYDVIIDEAGVYYISKEDGTPIQATPIFFSDEGLEDLKVDRELFIGLIEEGMIECDAETLTAFGLEPRFKLLGKNGKVERFYL